MKLNVVGDPEQALINKNELDEKAMGGTELMKYALHDKLPAKLLKQFNIIPSRVRELAQDKENLLWLHDLPQDPESQHLKDGGWKKFKKLVYVSHWQKQQYENFLGVPPSAGVVMQNAIEPIPTHTKPDPAECVNIIYHTTPHRGLELLIPILKHIREVMPDVKWHLDVYSSFGIYGWEQRDEPYQKLFQTIRDDEDMTYHGHVPNEEVKVALQKAHVYAFPSIWPETSCISLLEAMSAGCICVHSSLAALPETAANWTFQYDFTEDMQEHATRHAVTLMDALRVLKDDNMQARLNMQMSYTNGFYGWSVREQQWKTFLTNLLVE
jgi:glycosyltransferase involved in cell wall biosynthesis|tara:strand:+ start:519 stop:1493 length:975 start_codon:yes stop_codon:yes gene_type:complete